jgi:hypothetical protein
LTIQRKLSFSQSDFKVSQDEYGQTIIGADYFLLKRIS